MELVYDYPPNYKEIAEAFNIKDNEAVIFTYGNQLFVPSGKDVTKDKPLMKHEAVHARQQTELGIEKWWDRFLVDPMFRMSQELEAYREQYRAMGNLPISKRVGYLNHIARDLSGEMYGNIMSFNEAVTVITEGTTFNSAGISKAKSAAKKAKKTERKNRKKGRK